MKYLNLLFFVAFSLVMSGCVVPVADYRLEGEDTFVIICYGGQSALGVLNYSVYVDPVRKIAFIEGETQYKLKERKRLVRIFEKIEISDEEILFSSLESNDFVLLNRKTSELVNTLSKTFAKRCQSSDSWNGNQFVSSQIRRVKFNWAKIEDNIYREP